MNKGISRRLAFLERIQSQRVDLSSFDTAALDEFREAAAKAQKVCPGASQAEAVAQFLGLRSAASVIRMLASPPIDLEAEAEQDYRQEHGDGWRDEWMRRMIEFDVLAGGS